MNIKIWLVSILFFVFFKIKNNNNPKGEIK